MRRRFPVWVKLWVTPTDPLFDPHYFRPKQNKNSRNPTISGVSWSCYPDLNWRPHPYQRRRKNISKHKHHKTKNFRRAIQLLRRQKIAAGGPGPLFFHTLQRLPALDLIPMPRRAYKRGNPHGDSLPGLASPFGGGLQRADTPLAPHYAHGTRTARASSVWAPCPITRIYPL